MNTVVTAWVDDENRKAKKNRQEGRIGNQPIIEVSAEFKKYNEFKTLSDISECVFLSASSYGPTNIHVRSMISSRFEDRME